MHPTTNLSVNHNYSKATLSMLVATFCFGVMTALIKRYADVPTAQLMFFRSAIALLVAVGYVLARRQLTQLRTQRPGLHLIRGLLGVASMACTFAAFQMIPLATASALFHTKALFIAPLAALILGERFYGRRVFLTVLGFVGIAIMLDPTAPDFSTGSLLALLAAFIGSLAMICVRNLGRSESSIAIVFYFMLIATLVSSVCSYNQWQPIESLTELLILSTIGISGVLGQAAMVIAYRAAEASFVAPLDYIQLVWAGIFGLLFWQEVPSHWLLLGAGLIVISQVLLQRHAYVVRTVMLNSQVTRRV